MSVETHEVLRKLPISELGAALAVAIIDNARDKEPISAVYGLIALAEVMAAHSNVSGACFRDAIERRLICCRHARANG